MTKEKALLLDVTYFDDKEASIISLFVQREGKHYWLKDNEFRPYFYVLSGFSEKEKVVRDIKGFEFGVEEKFNVLRVEGTNKSHNSKSVIKIVFNKVSQLISARKILSEMGFERYEYDVPYAKRYLIDNRLEPGNFIEYEVILEEKINSTKKEVNAKDFESEEGELVSGEGKIVKEISVVEGNFEGKGLAFDLETYSREKFGIGFEPIIMTSIVSSDLDSESKEKSYERVLSYNTASVKGLELVSDEKELIKETIKELNKKENSFVITYNGDNFDFAYLKERARKNKLEFKVNNSFVKSVRHGRDNAVKLLGVQHIDSFQIIKLLARTGAINTVKMDIETISEKVFGEFKEKVYPSEINEAWEEKNEEKLERLVDYNLKDSRTALRIAKEFLPLFVELSKLTSQTLYETTRSTTSQMVEDLLLKEAHLRGMIAPNKPKEGEIQERSNNPIKGAFVKEPTSGLHENIAVLDFASLYPSIIISHNLSPETLNCGHEECKQKNSTPDGTWFCTKQKGLFPEILEKMLKQRLVLKREYKRKKKEEGIDDKILFAKQWALKIVLNSVYGYLAYARARWYSRECASATTALARGYIQETIKKAEKTGFEVLYGDSITKNRFITVLNPKGQIEVKNVEQLFNEINAPVIFVRGKEVKSAKGYCALSVNTDTRKAEWAKINEIIRHKTDKLVFRVNQKFGETICTEDHSIITEDNFVLKETKPQEMNGRKFFSVQSIPQSKEINEIDLFELLKSQHYKRIYKNQDEVSQWDCDGNYITFGFKGFGDRIKLKRFIKVGSREFEALCRLLGAYIAEGSSSTLETTYSRFGASIASSNIAWLKELEKDY
ncbi:MAG: DNA polymerase domain-containing protein, partial [archaeon]